MSGRVLVVIAYFADGSVYPRAGARRSHGETYWANIAACAATLRHVAGPTPELVVFAGDEPPEPMAAVLAVAGGRVRHLDFARRPPADFYERYLGSLYVLDVMAALADEVDDDDVVLLVDPDIVWVRPIEPLVADVRAGGVVAYDLQVPEDVPLCGLTRRRQTEMVAELLGVGPGPEDPAIAHFGGELYGVLGRELRDLVPVLEDLWAKALARHEAGLDHHNTEEHFVNVAMWVRGEQEGRANAHIQRIRTLPKPFGTRERATPGLVAWHLPMEKDQGLLDLFDHLAVGRSLPPADDGYVRWLGAKVGVAPRGARWLGDRARQLKWAVTGRSWGGHPNHGL